MGEKKLERRRCTFPRNRGKRLPFIQFPLRNNSEIKSYFIPAKTSPSKVGLLSPGDRSI
jgi:hypothetical protein